jgi:hypothetical protein
MSSLGQFQEHLDLVLLQGRPLGPYARQHPAGTFGKPLVDLSRKARGCGACSCEIMTVASISGVAGRPPASWNEVLRQVSPLGGDKVGL